MKENDKEERERTGATRSNLICAPRWRSQLRGDFARFQRVRESVRDGGGLGDAKNLQLADATGCGPAHHVSFTAAE